VELDVLRTQRAKVRIAIPSTLVPGEELIERYPSELRRALDLVRSVYGDEELFAMATDIRGIADEIIEIDGLRSLDWGVPEFDLAVPAMRDSEV